MKCRPGSWSSGRGVEVVLFVSGDKTLRFVGGSLEAEDLKRFVESNALKP